jgi:hypothetical protein
VLGPVRLALGIGEEEEVTGALAIGVLVLPVVVLEPRRFLEEDGAMGGKVTATSFVTGKIAEPLCETMCVRRGGP